MNKSNITNDLFIEIFNSSINISSNHTNKDHHDGQDGMQFVLLIFLFCMFGLIIFLGISCGLQVCSKQHGYSSFIVCVPCEIINMILTLLCGDKIAERVMNKLRNKSSSNNNGTIYYTDSDSDSEEDYNNCDFTIVKIQPELEFAKDNSNFIQDENIDDELTCSICLNKIDEQDNLNDKNNENNENNVNNEINIVKLECGHYYHSKCIEDWYKSSINKDCPLCKKKIGIEEHYYAFNA